MEFILLPLNAAEKLYIIGVSILDIFCSICTLTQNCLKYIKVPSFKQVKPFFSKIIRCELFTCGLINAKNCTISFKIRKRTP